MATLDVAEQQVAVRYPDDPNFRFHQRVLVRRVRDSVWICFTPDLSVQVIDLAQHHVVPLVRASPIPQRIRGDYYGIDDIEPDVLAEVRRDCDAMAEIHGAAPAAAPAGAGAANWRFADPSFEKYGELVDAAAMGTAARHKTADAVGIAHVDVDGEMIWTAIEKVADDLVDDWKEEKRVGPGRDPRVLPLEKDGAGARYRSLRSAMTEMTYHPTREAGKPGASASQHWPFEGPSAFLELMTAVRASGEELVGFHDYYVRGSGISPDSPIAYKHRDLMSILAHLLSWDQANGGQLASAELTARLVLQIHTAVKKNPKAPDFKGTNLMITSTMDAAGGVTTGPFARYVAEEQRTHAYTLKQQRLFAEEEEKRAAGKKGAKKE